MGSSGVETVKAVKYFNEIEELNKNISNHQNYNADSLTEKIRLEFSLKNCSSGAKYSIIAFFLEKEEKDFNSEEKTPKNDEIAFDNFYICDYYFEKEQKMQIILYKEDSSPITIMTTLAAIIGSKRSTFVKVIENKEHLIVKAVKLGKENSYVNINIRIKNSVPNNDYLENNKLIFIIKCKDKKIYSSESITSNGIFDQIKIPSYLLFPEYIINICDPKDNNKIKASYTKTIESLKYQNANDTNLQLKLPISKTLSLSIYDNSEYKDYFTLFDLISSGVRLNLSIGIDFTGSNGHPLDKDTLHCIINEEPNDYEKVIKSIGNILSNYNYKKLYPVYGFGAIINSSLYQEVSMCFNINFQENPEIYTINNVINVYRGCLDKLTFAGPTYFSPILHKVIEEIRKRDNNLEYNILMILTDGVIDDMELTIDALVEGSYLPLSVIIVGIGNADFSKMVKLDGNEIPLVSKQDIKWLRDIVQFIQYNKYKNDETKLTKEILEEIPRQVVEYYTLNDFNPDKLKLIYRRVSSQYNISEAESNIPQNYVNEFQNNAAQHNVPDLPTKSQIYNLKDKNESNNNINNNYNNSNQYNNNGSNNNNIPNQYDNINLSNNFSNNNDLHNNFNLFNNNTNDNKNNYNNTNLNNNNIGIKDNNEFSLFQNN